MQQEPASSAQLVRWPISLCELLAAHMQAVEHPHQPSFPPFGDVGKRSCYAVLRDVFDRFHLLKRFSSPHEKNMSEMIFALIIQLMEDSCVKNFLKPREREKLKAAFTRKHAHTATTRKRGKEDEANHIAGEVMDKSHFTAQLPSDYLLRFFAALPLLVDTFLNFCGGGVETSLLGALWNRVELALKELEGSAVFYSPASDYQP